MMVFLSKSFDFSIILADSEIGQAHNFCNVSHYLPNPGHISDSSSFIRDLQQIQSFFLRNELTAMISHWVAYSLSFVDDGTTSPIADDGVNESFPTCRCLCPLNSFMEMF